jgi:hypothetical protein
MRPIVDGLEAQYGEEVDFLYLNAEDGGAGQAAFTYYALRGHPSVLIAAPGGEVIWQGVGVVEGIAIEQQIQSVAGDEEG